MKILEFSKVTFGYDHEPVLQDATLEVEKGDFFGILGPNGAGKSTLLKIALGLLRPWSGKVRLFGKENFSEWEKVGYVPQKPTFEKFFPATVFEIVSMGLRPFPSWSGPTESQKKAVLETLNEVGIERKKDELVGNLSGGQLQRVLLAKALVGKPQLLLLDEPTSGIDAEFEEKFCCLLERINKEGTTIVLVTHDMTFMSYLVNKVACVNRRVYFCGRPSNLLADSIKKAYGHSTAIVSHPHMHE
ncbi:MAG: ABC transporter ATP-binding protein [Candidatus Anstonellaceae archaeon]